MRKLLFTLILTLLLIPVLTVQAQEATPTPTPAAPVPAATTAPVADTGCTLTAVLANIRQQPNLEATVIGQVVTGVQRVVIGRNGEWWQIDGGGWVSSTVSNVTGESCATITGTSTPAPTEDATCTNAAPPRLVIGQQGRVTPGLKNNIRSEASRHTRLLGQMSPGETFEVVSGPVCTGGFNWWQIRFGEITGYTPEGLVGDYYLEPVQQ